MTIDSRGRRVSDAARPLAPLGFAALLCVHVLFAGQARAVQEVTPASSRNGTVGLVGVLSGELQTRGVLSVSIGGHYYESPDLADALGCDSGRYASFHLAGSYGVSTWAEIGVDVPFRRATWACGAADDRSTQALDNPLLAVKVALPPSSGWLHLAGLARVGLPADAELSVEDQSDESVYLAGGRTPDWEVLLLATARFAGPLPVRIHANAGWASHREDGRGRSFYPSHYPAIPEGGDPTDNDALILRGAVEFTGRRVDLFTEFRGDLILDRELVAPKENALTVTPGLRIRFADRWSATLGFSVGVSGNDRDTEFDPYDAFPDWEATLAVAYTWPFLAADSDGDGLPDFRDGCPVDPEDYDGFEDDDGCPDPDNDGDGIRDALDGAPELPEDVDGFEDGDGVPDLDNDSDGIVDERDMCPNEREDLDGFEDEDGCPDP